MYCLFYSATHSHTRSLNFVDGDLLQMRGHWSPTFSVERTVDLVGVIVDK